MGLAKHREIVVEIEHVRVVRKKCKAHIFYCSECRRETDFIRLPEAAKLFEVDTAKLMQFINANHIHRILETGGETLICLAPFLDRVKEHLGISQPKLIGGT
jgi:riboflavin biosynthesis pyrimidine reductase